MMISGIGSASSAAALSAIAVTTAAGVSPAAPVKSAVTERAGDGDNTHAGAKSAQIDDGDDNAPIAGAGAAEATSSSRVLAALTQLKFGG
jgi:hypothetical protein